MAGEVIVTLILIYFIPVVIVVTVSDSWRKFFIISAILSFIWLIVSFALNTDMISRNWRYIQFDQLSLSIITTFFMRFIPITLFSAPFFFWKRRAAQKQAALMSRFDEPMPQGFAPVSTPALSVHPSAPAVQAHQRSPAAPFKAPGLLAALPGMLGSGFFLLFFLVAHFPGGTIIMALSCRKWDVDGWDWVLSVFIPMYGVLKAAFYC